MTKSDSKTVKSCTFFLGILFALSACQGEIAPNNTTPVPPPNPHDQCDDDSTLWEPLSDTTYSDTFYAIAGFNSEAIFLGAQNGRLYYWDGLSLELLATLVTEAGVAPDLNGIWASSDEQGKVLFIVGGNGAVFRSSSLENDVSENTEFTQFETNTISEFRAIAGFSREDIWTVGDGGIYHFDGGTWLRDTSVPGNPKLYDIRATVSGNPNDMFAVGQSGTILHRTLSSDQEETAVWETVSVGRSEDLHGIWSPGDGTMYVAGQAGLVLYFDGTTWTTLETDTMDNLWAIHGMDTDNIFAAGSNGTILFLDGGAWSRQPTGTCNNFYHVWSTDIQHVYAVGTRSTFLRFDDDQTPPP